MKAMSTRFSSPGISLGTRLWFGRTLYVSDASHVFDESGELIDQVPRDRLQAYLAGFVEFVRRIK